MPLYKKNTGENWLQLVLTSFTSL